MSGQRKRLQAFLDAIIDLPVEVTACEKTRSNHVKVYIRHEAATRFFVVAGSPSDVRSAMNFRGQINNWLKQKGEYDDTSR